MDYYCGKHIPMVRQKLGAACKPAFIAQAHFLFDSVESFQKAFAPHADTIMADIPNYTDLPPIIQLNEVKL